MFRAALSIVFLIAFAIQTFHRGEIVVSYYLNKDAYAKNCVNKGKPVLKCSGKCQMAKKILEQEKQEEQAPEQKLENKFQSLWSNSHFALFGFHKTVSTLTYNLYRVKHLPSSPLESIFHSPCVA